MTLVIEMENKIFERVVLSLYKEFNIEINEIEKILTDEEYLNIVYLKDPVMIMKIEKSLEELSKECQKESEFQRMRLSKYDTDDIVNAYMRSRTIERTVNSYIKFIKDNIKVTKGNR